MINLDLASYENGPIGKYRLCYATELGPGCASLHFPEGIQIQDYTNLVEGSI